MNYKLLFSRRGLICVAVILVALFSNQNEQLLRLPEGILTQILYFSKYFGVAILAAYTLSERNRKVRDAAVIDYMRVFCPLLFLMVITEGIAAVTSPVPGIYGSRYWTRTLSIFIDRICIWIAILSCWSLCGENAFGYLVTAFFIDQFMILFASLFYVGPLEIFRSLFGSLSLAEGTSFFFEVHELTFCLGLLLIYFLFFQKKTRKSIFVIICIFFWFLVGSKRIAIAGIAAASVFAFLFHKKGMNRRMIIAIGTIGVCICVAYVASIYNGFFMMLLSRLNINKMGRDLIYGFFTRRSEFSPTQLGWGMAGVAKMIENMPRSEVGGMQVVGGLHNDLLKIYINFGFWGSLCWYAYHLVYFPLKLFEKYGKRQATIYLCLAVYMFVTYLTDNTEGYFVCQVLFFLIPIADFQLQKSCLQEPEKLILSDADWK